METLAITRLLNALFGPAVTAVMNLLHVHPANPAAPINNTFALEFLVFAILIAFFLLVGSRSPWRSRIRRNSLPK